MSKYNPSFIVNSKNRISGTESTFTHLVDIDNTRKFDLVACVNCNIPNTFYNMNAGKNFFTLREGLQERIIYFPIGNYNENNFSVILPNLLNAASTDMGNNFIYFCGLPNPNTQLDTRKWLFTVTNNLGVQPQFEILTDEDIDELMGFDKGVYNFVGDKLESTNVVNFHLSHYIVVKTNLCSNQGNSIIDHNILATINIDRNLNFGDSINYNISELKSQSRLLNNKSNKIFTFSIHNDRNEELNLNGHDWSLEVLLYQYDDVSEITKADILAKHIEIIQPKEPQLTSQVVERIQKSS